MREPRWQISSRARGAGEKQSDDGLTAQTKKSAERCHIGKGAKFIHNRAHLDARHHQVPNAQFTPMFTVHKDARAPVSLHGLSGLPGVSSLPGMAERARTAAANVGLATAGLLPTNMLGSAVPGRLAMGLPPSGPVQLGPYVAVPGRSLRSLRGPHSNLGRSPTMGTISLASIRSLRPDMDEPPHRFQNTPVRDAPCLVASTSAPS